MISREDALAFVNEQIENKNIVKHMLALEACMIALAGELKVQSADPPGGEAGLKVGEEIDEGVWGLAGLLHDADYTDAVPPEQQGVRVTGMLREQGHEIPEELAHAMAAHNASNTGVQPESLMDWAIFCADSLTGLIVATTLVRPDKKLSSVTVESVLKKFKSPSFASGTRREDIALCEENLGLSLAKFVGICLSAMQEISADLGL